MMTDSGYTLRNYRSSDLEGCARLWQLEGQDQTGHYISPQIVKMLFEKPNFSAEETVLVAEKNGNIIACLNITPELGIKHANIHCIVHPKHRRKGIATSLFNQASEWIENAGAKAAHAGILQKNAVAKKLMHKLGFKPVHQFIEMHLTLDVKPAKILSTSVMIRHLKRGEEDRLADLQNRAFADHWGYNPNTVEEITSRLNRFHGSHQHVILACDGDKPIAYCWTTTILQTNPVTGKRHGRILMLGVDPDYQSKSIGKAVLVAGLSSLFDRGVDVVEITADSENKKARSLYKAAGFKGKATSQCYEKVLE